MKTITWVLAHEPYDLFLRAARHFSREVAEKTNSEINIEVLGLTEYEQKYNAGQAIDRYKLLDMVNNGTVAMSQMYTTTLGQLDKDMFVLDMPFIFRDNAHAESVLDGQVGRQLFDSLASKTNVQGLAFTYSGGFRIIPGNEVIATLEQFKGMKVRVANCPVAEDTFRAVGADPVVIAIEKLADSLEAGDVDMGESTYPRIYSMRQNEVATVINHTEHSLFLTSIIINKGLWASLDAETQQIFADAAISAAHIERAESLEHVDSVQAQAQQDGIQVSRLSATERARFKLATEIVYDQYQDYFTPGLVDQIKRS
ncbi:DctP TRAP-type C4-dicarboxylate transport system, periplasmic component [uncultured Caudovirales phage]|uniref:DctP TRAP-type C4-dicarboxylate transport system, periplasmic component n=1 Tax=uncultured Caudovirales phage TaxID=2100421 RepID=A0A6J5L4H3_9CAUD|nr:DctP TRAP-type C4-dicarboxylate transport system, periplasmic component [uncultured Caudovirales phage]